MALIEKRHISSKGNFYALNCLGASRLNYHLHRYIQVCMEVLKHNANVMPLIVCLQQASNLLLLGLIKRDPTMIFQ
jgi:hypothetical protein